MIEEQLNNIEQEINKIKERNARVEGDKAWETSKTRIGFIFLITYIITSVIFYIIGVNSPFLNALIPTIAFFLSVQSLPLIKRWWLKRYYKKTNEKPGKI